MQTAISKAPPEKKPHNRVPSHFALAQTPADRAILLAGGTAEHLAAVLNCSASTVRNWRARSRSAGRVPTHHQKALLHWAAEQGWDLPEGFLTDFKVFEDPREVAS